MAAPASLRALSRAFPRTSTSTFRTTTTRFAPTVRAAFQQQSRRGYADAAGVKSGSSALYWVLGLGVVGAGGVYAFTQSDSLKNVAQDAKAAAVPITPKFEDYEKVYNMIAKRLEEHDSYDDGSYGPVLLRLAWHASGTYDAETKTGGSNGATMRFAPERDHGANSGLAAAQSFLEPVKEAFPWLTYGDLWTLAGVASIQEMHGPVIPWRPGREDRDISFCTPDGRLPDASKEQKHLRGIFGRMGFNDQEIVALSGAHALGRCHTDRSGFEGPWTFSPTILTNDYYKLLMNERWSWRKWNGPKQYEDVSTKTLMMLPTDMALIKDKTFKTHVERYAKDNDVFFKEFSDVIAKLFELGVPFKVDEKWRFKPVAPAAA